MLPEGSIKSFSMLPLRNIPILKNLPQAAAFNDEYYPHI
jgi:hypothetical protein